MNRGDSQNKLNSVKQKRLSIHTLTGTASMSPQVKLQMFSYLKGRVVVCYVGVVVPGGRLGEEHHLLCSAVVVKEKLLCIWQCVWIVWRLPFFSQRLRGCQHLHQHQDCPEKPAHSPGKSPQEERGEKTYQVKESKTKKSLKRSDDQLPLQLLSHPLIFPCLFNLPACLVNDKKKDNASLF